MIRRIRQTLQTAAVTLAVFTAPTGSAFAQDAEQDLREATERYLEAWSYTEEEGVAALEDLRDVFADGPIYTVDTFAGGATVTTSVDEYLTTWKPIMGEAVAEQTARAVGPIEVWVGETSGTTGLVLEGRGTTPSGEPNVFRQAGTFVWELRDGEWRMVREQLITLDPE